MAYSRSTAEDTGSTHDPVVDRRAALETGVPVAQAPRADEVPGPSLPLAVKLYEVRKPYNQWLHGYFIELHHIGPVDVGPLLPEPHRCDNIDCIECWNKSVRYEDYRKAKRLRDINGF